VLQGGGALGAYQAGVYQALHEADIRARLGIWRFRSGHQLGHHRQRRFRLQRLRTFWERITERKVWSYTPDGDGYRLARNATSSWLTMCTVSLASSPRARPVPG
jgi:NTE family protein